MGGCRCSYRNCKSSTKLGADLHFFHFPVKNRERCREWIQNSRRPDFQNLPIDQLRNKVICGLHFEDPCFTNTHRKRLIHDAVPTLSVGCEDTEVQMDPRDIQVLPANADGTIFTVDTDSMQPQTLVESMCTYSIKNGKLIPVFSNNIIDTTDILYVDRNEFQTIEANHNEYLFIESKAQITDAGFNGDIIPESTEFVNVATEFAECNSNNVVVYDNCETMEIINETVPLEAEVEEQTLEVDIRARAHKRKRKTGKKCKNFTKYVLHQLKKHTAEIASLKHALHKYISHKPGNILKAVRGRVPSSMLTLIRKQLSKQNGKFTAEQVDLLTGLYSPSPVSYNLLKDRFQWHFVEKEINLP